MVLAESFRPPPVPLVFHDQSWFLVGTASLALHAVDHYLVDGSAVRVAEVAGLAALNGVFALTPRPVRGSVAVVLGVLPTFGAFAGHILPYLRTGQITPATGTAVFNLGGGLLLAALGTALFSPQSKRFGPR